MLKLWDLPTLLEPMTLLKDYDCDPYSFRPPAIAMPCHPGPMALQPAAKPPAGQHITFSSLLFSLPAAK